ncbi:MAG: GNAT family N-acetyltransferase [Deltaproteobacteria bacterium]|nr:GNAT family N-acetyltransferase [Deltaproteobacteria bacterium]
MELIFRVATRADLDSLLPLVRAYYEFDHLAFDEGIARTALGNFIDDPTFGRVWLIYDEAEAIGYLVLTLGYSLEYGGRDAFIDEVYIRAEYRGHGIGRQAMAFAETQCRAVGVRALHLEVERDNTNAHALYRKVGFVDHDRYLMTKRIS